MKKDDEMWLKRMQEMLIDYDEPAPAGSWERLEKDLQPQVRIRMIPKLYRIAAAAAILVALSGISLYFLQSPAADDIRMANTSANPGIADKIPVAPVPDGKAVRVEQAHRITEKKKPVLAQVTDKTVVEEQLVLVDDEVKPEANNETVDEINDNRLPIEEKSKEVIVPQTGPDEKESTKQISRPSGKDKLHLPAKTTSSSGSGKWSMALAVNAGGTSSFTNNGTGAGRPRSISMTDFASIANSPGNNFVDLANNELLFKDGIPFVMPISTAYDHKQPVTFGLSVRKGITSTVSLETGLTYTLLASEIYKNGENTSKTGEQKLHYIGIPLRVNWSFVNSDRFNVYLTGGGAVEKSVHGDSPVEDFKNPKALQFSLTGSIGAQFNITRKLGIYAEPGVAYFFDDGSDVESIRKDKPFNINLQAGIRLTY